MDGKVVIGTEVDTKGVDDGLKEIYDLIDNSDYGKKQKISVVGDSKKQKKDIQEVKATYEELADLIEQTQQNTDITFGNKNDLKKQLAETQKMLEKFQEENKKLTEQKIEIEKSAGYKEAFEQLEDSKKILKSTATSRSLSETPLDLEKSAYSTLSDEQKQTLNNYEAIKEKIKENEKAQSDLNQKIGEMEQISTATQKIGEITPHIVEQGTQIKLAIDDIGKGIRRTVRNVQRWVLGIFGVYSAYGAIRNAMNVISQNDKQLKADIDYMKNAIAYALEPVVRTIVNWAKQLLVYISYIANAWFGINIFENANKSLKNANSNAKALKKTLAGFDEMNILSDNSGSGITSPSFDLSKIQGNVPEWIKWIGDNGENILAIVSGITAALISMRLFGLRPIVSLGIGVAVAGLVKMIIDLIAYIKHPSWRKFVDILTDLSVVLVGIGVTLIAINATNPVGWIMLIVGAVGLLIRNLDKVIDALGLDKARILSTKKAHEQLTDAINATKRAQDEYVNAVDNAEQAEKDLIEVEKKHGISGKQLYDLVRQGKLDYRNMTTEQREVYKAYTNNLNAQEDLTEATQELTQKTKEQKDAFWDEQLSIAQTSGSYDELKDKIVKAVEEQELSVEEAQDLVERAMAGMSDKTAKTFTEDMPSDIKDGLNPDKYRTIWSRFKTEWNQFFGGLKTKLTVKADLDTSAIKAHGLNYHVTKGAKGLMIYSGIPKLAKGGIINNPGPGVAIGGEVAKEAVVPLTDSQQMALLGEAIGKYITVNANIVNTMNGRVISRELQKVQNDSDFAYNR